MDYFSQIFDKKGQIESCLDSCGLQTDCEVKGIVGNMMIETEDIIFDMNALHDITYSHFRKLLGEFTVRKCSKTLEQGDLVMVKDIEWNEQIFITIDEMY